MASESDSGPPTAIDVLPQFVNQELQTDGPSVSGFRQALLHPSPTALASETVGLFLRLSQEDECGESKDHASA